MSSLHTFCFPFLCVLKRLHAEPFVRVKFVSAGEESRIFYYGFDLRTNVQKRAVKNTAILFSFNSPIDLHLILR